LETPRTTLAAAEMTERVCCGMELDPKYVDVVVQRWQELSGKKARLEGTDDRLRMSLWGSKEQHESNAAAGRSRPSKRRSAQVIRICRGCAWRSRTGRRN